MMQLIVDSGSTKADWVLISSDNSTKKTKTKGLNPAVFSNAQLLDILNTNDDLLRCKAKVNTVHFYGAGCGTEKPKTILRSILSDFFSQAKVNVHEDTLAAVYANLSSKNNKAIVCILGTGSNCSYYNGDNLEQRVTSLGYAIMDDASGNYFGRQLLRDYYFKKMPKQLALDFESKYNLSADEIKLNLYKKGFPNAYLANFAKIMISYKDSDYVKKIIKIGLTLFIENMLMQFKTELKTVPVHFVGSIAFFCKEELKALAETYHFKLGNVTKQPIDGLIDFHKAI